MTGIQSSLNPSRGLSPVLCFEWKFCGEPRYTDLGRWWDRKGENEIDLVCEDEHAGELDFYVVKRNRAAIDLNVLEGKAVRFFEKHPQKAKHRNRFLALSLDDMYPVAGHLTGRSVSCRILANLSREGRQNDLLLLPAGCLTFHGLDIR